MALPALALPGQPLASASARIPGPGTYIRDGTIVASIAGQPIVTSRQISENDAVNSTLGSKSSLSVIASSTSVPATPASKSLPSLDALPKASPPLPSVGAEVLAKVIRLQATMQRATMEILAVDNVEAKPPFWHATVRSVDVRAMEKDKVKVQEAFRVGDLVKGRIISLGDQTSYYIATDKNELGVVLAVSEAGNQMYPISWKEFRDPVTGQTEERKVAKPF